MLTDDQISAAAADLAEAADTHQLATPLTRRFTDMTIPDAYAIQRARVKEREAAGERVAGHKVGVTSRPLQRSLGLEAPIFGTIFADDVRDSGASFDWSLLHGPRLEVELAFMIAEDLVGPSISPAAALAATEYVRAALEVVDTRVSPDGSTMVDAVADNSSLGAIVLGEKEVRPDLLNLRWSGAMLYRNDELVGTGLSAGALGNPANSLAWLANTLPTYGDHLRAGEVVMTGAFIAPLPVEQGDHIRVNYGHLGEVTCAFA